MWPMKEFPPFRLDARNQCLWRAGEMGKNGAYVYLCAVRLPARKCSVLGYAIIVRFTDGIGPLKATYGMWQDAQA